MFVRVFKVLVVLFCLGFPLVIQGQFEDDQFDLNEGWFTVEMYNDPYFVELRNHHGVIFPGTKWCGEGDKAANFSDLGKFNETDACCRAHDNCPVVIKAGQSLHGLINSDSSSRLSCGCDTEFYQCLKEIEDVTSKTIGTIFFDILKKKCLGEKNGKYEWKYSPGYSNAKFIKYVSDLKWSRGK